MIQPFKIATTQFDSTPSSEYLIFRCSTTDTTPNISFAATALETKDLAGQLEIQTGTLYLSLIHI